MPDPAIHVDVFHPTLYESVALNVSVEQKRLIRQLLLLTSADTQLAQKAADAITVILTGTDTPTPPNEAPVLSTMSPDSAPTNTFVRLTFFGSGFDQSCVVCRGSGVGVPIPTLYVSPNQMQADVNLTGAPIRTDIPFQIRNNTTQLSSEVKAFNVTAT